MWELTEKVGESYWAGLWMAFIAFGSFSALLQVLLLMGFFPRHVHRWAALASVIAAGMQWLVCLADGAKYDVSWYAGLVTPVVVWFKPYAFESTASVAALVVPSGLIVLTTVWSALILTKSMVLDPPHEPAERPLSVES